VSLSSITSSWIRAAAWNSSRAGAAPAPVAERRAQPLAVAEEVLDGLHQRRQVVADAVEDGGLVGERVVERLADAVPQALDVEGPDVGFPAGRHTSGA